MSVDECVAQFHAENSDEFRLFVRTGNLSLEKRALSAVTGADAGTTVPQAFKDAITEALKRYSAVMDVCTILDTKDGRPMPWPSICDVQNQAEQTAENAALTITDGTVTTPGDPVFSSVTFNSYMYDSGIIQVGISLLADATPVFETRLIQVLARRIGRALNPLLTTGTGTAQPTGIITAAIQGAQAAQANAISYQDLLNLEHAVDPEYRVNGVYMCNDATLKSIRGLTDTAQRPLFLANGKGSKKNGKLVGMLNGFPLSINPAMAGIGASAKSLLFGDMSNFIVRTTDETLFRFAERYMDRLQVGLMLRMRADSNLQDAGTRPVQYLQHPGS